jgi:dTDP-4-dehydrorhamnose 3,5-epimerase
MSRSPLDLQAMPLPGCWEIRPHVRCDIRGRFVKVFHAPTFSERGLRIDFVEQYYSVSSRRVLRGLHFQTPPHDHAKLVYCVSGSVMDVVVDLRRGSPTFGHHASVTLSAEAANALYIPVGLAHGFYTLSEAATMIYGQTSLYAPDHDTGVLWNSAGIEWPDEAPLLSERDRGFVPLKDFRSPFVLETSAS